MQCFTSNTCPFGIMRFLFALRVMTLTTRVCVHELYALYAEEPKQHDPQSISHLLANTDVLDRMCIVHEQRSLPQANCSLISSIYVLIGISFWQRSLLIIVSSLKSYYRNNFKPKTPEQTAHQTLAAQSGPFTPESTWSRLHLLRSQHLAIHIKAAPIVSSSKCPQ